MIPALSQQLYRRYLLWQTRPSLIKAHLTKLQQQEQQQGYSPIPIYKQALPPPQGGKNTKHQSNKLVRVAAVQSRLTLVKHVREYLEIMYRFTSEAARQGAQLVVFPEDNAAQLIGLLPGSGELKLETNLVEAAPHSATTPLQFGEVFSYLTPVTKQVYLTIFQELAKLFSLYIMGGSIIINNPPITPLTGHQPAQVVNIAYLFNPAGSLAGQQLKAHLLPIEASWGISCGCELRVFPTPIGKLAFPICMDATYFETFRILGAKGAEIVMVPTANPDQYNFWKALRGTWPRVQETPVYGIVSAMVGSLAGVELTGRAAVFAPLALTPNGDGVLAQAPHPTEDALVIADLDLTALEHYRQESQIWSRLNRQLVAKYLPQLY